MNLRRLSRAEYWWQPLQLPRRAWRLVQRLGGADALTLKLPWGYPLSVHPRESIGRSVVALNTHDLPVTEALWRLLDAGESAADVGANIGYMTSVLAARLRDGGVVWAFEPLPELAERLRAHVEGWRSLGRAELHVKQAAVSDTAGYVDLFTPSDWALNHGTASLAAPDVGGTGSTRVPVECCTLDEVFAELPPPAVLKVDVEGCEARVFSGASRLLAAGAIRDIVFEEHRTLPAESTELLRSHGYTVFRILRRFSGPQLAAQEGAARGEIDPPAFLGTRNPQRAQARFRKRGWLCLWRANP